jgi:hypothetical protein
VSLNYPLREFLLFFALPAKQFYAGSLLVADNYLAAQPYKHIISCHLSTLLPRHFSPLLVFVLMVLWPAITNNLERPCVIKLPTPAIPFIFALPAKQFYAGSLLVADNYLAAQPYKHIISCHLSTLLPRHLILTIIVSGFVHSHIIPTSFPHHSHIKATSYHILYD